MAGSHLYRTGGFGSEWTASDSDGGIFSGRATARGRALIALRSKLHRIPNHVFAFPVDLFATGRSGVGSGRRARFSGGVKASIVIDKIAAKANLSVTFALR